MKFASTPTHTVSSSYQQGQHQHQIRKQKPDSIRHSQIQVSDVYLSTLMQNNAGDSNVYWLFPALLEKHSETTRVTNNVHINTTRHNYRRRN